MTNGEMIQSMFPNMNFGTLAQDDVIVNRDYSNNDEPQVFIQKSVWNAEYKEPIKALEQEPFINKPCISEKVCKHDKQMILEKIRAEIKGKIEQEEFARSVFRHEEKDTAKAEQCTGSIMAYNNVIKLIDKNKAETEE